MTEVYSRYKRVLLKVSGESLMGPQTHGIHPATIDRLAGDIKSVADMGVEVGLVVGGGNIFRGIEGAVCGIERTQADYMGMLATVINSLALQSALERIGVKTRVMSAVPMPIICESYIRRRAADHLDHGHVVIFAAGTGNPFFTTDTAAALRAAEMNCDAILKGTKVDGVYSDDPVRVAEAKRYEHLGYMDVLSRDLKVMDAASIAIARENRIPVLVFSINEPGAFRDVLVGKGRFTVISD
ncbi:MAG: UMP kinase [Pseudomonadota bacterium]|nr:UMP kinase [Pseudomonadota bacterium]